MKLTQCYSYNISNKTRDVRMGEEIKEGGTG